MDLKTNSNMWSALEGPIEERLRGPWPADSLHHHNLKQKRTTYGHFRGTE